MDSEPLDFDALMQERRESAAATMQPMDVADVQAHVAKLLPNPDHPWHTVVNNFLAAHPIITAVHGSTSDGVEFIFFPRQHKGFWFQTTGGTQGVGPIQERGLTALSEIASEKGFS